MVRNLIPSPSALVEERWALLVMRELMLGQKRFKDLRASLPGLSANVLTQRLRSLEEAGVVRRARLPWPAAFHVYELTEWGYESEPVLVALVRWGVRSPFYDPELPITATSIMLFLRATFAPDRAKGLRARAAFHVGGESFVVSVERGTLRVSRGEAAGVDLVLSGGWEATARALHGGVSMRDLQEAGAATVTGDHDAAERFLGLFPLPSKASRPEGGQ